MRRLLLIAVLCVAVTITTGLAQAPQGRGGAAGGGRGSAAATTGLYNTAKQKLLDGEQVFSWTQW